MSKPISKEYFAIKVIERLNGCKHFTKSVVKGAVEYVKDGYSVYVADMTDEDLFNYVLNEVSEVLA